MTITIPDSVVDSANLTEEEVKQTLAIVLFQQKRLSLAQARKIAGMTRLEFQRLLGSRRIAIYDVEDFEQDLKTLKSMGRL